MGTNEKFVPGIRPAGPPDERRIGPGMALRKCLPRCLSTSISVPSCTLCSNSSTTEFAYCSPFRRRPPPMFTDTDQALPRWTGVRTSPCMTSANALVSGLTRSGPGNPPPSSKLAKHLVDGHFRRGGAGGNRTPVRQPVDEPATTIPGYEAVAASPAGRSTTASGGPRSVFPERQPSFRPSAVFPAVISRFCCRAAGERPRVAFLLTMSLHSPGDQAARANCSVGNSCWCPV